MPGEVPTFVRAVFNHRAFQVVRLATAVAALQYYPTPGCFTARRNILSALDSSFC